MILRVDLRESACFWYSSQENKYINLLGSGAMWSHYQRTGKPEFIVLTCGGSSMKFEVTHFHESDTTYIGSIKAEKERQGQAYSLFVWRDEANMHDCLLNGIEASEKNSLVISKPFRDKFNIN